MERRIAPLADLLSLFRLTRALLRLRPDITEFSTPKAGLLGNIAALLCGVPHRVYLLRGLRLETASGPRRWILRATERLAAACSHVVLCNSRSLRQEACALRLTDAKKLQMLGPGSSNGVDVARFSPGATNVRLQISVPPSAPVIGFVGRLTRDKGLPELVLAFDRVLETQPAARLLLVGWWDESEDAVPLELRSRIEQHPKILRTGFVSDTSPWYRMMDVLVLPTLREGFPNVVLEAAASGIPVITTHATGARDAVLAGETGLLVPPGEVEALAQAMLELLASPVRRMHMGAAARKWVTQHFLQSRVHALTVAHYQDMMQGRTDERVPVFVRGAAAAAD
jgi:glycosyltransferase involved in cell wall biosynthesis